ncbi:terminase small subunit [Rhodovibrio sodomensis]|nr:terminase small subunit [Rhodovibrio sodomensis]
MQGFEGCSTLPGVGFSGIVHIRTFIDTAKRRIVAMPAKMTEMQQVFALEYARNGGNGTAAAKTAGYSERSAHEQARQNLNLPHVQEAIRKALLKQRAESGVIGLYALRQVAQDPKAPHAAKVSAGRALCEHAGQLGTAKELEAERDAADNGDKDAADPMDFLRAILDGRDVANAG